MGQSGDENEVIVSVYNGQNIVNITTKMRISIQINHWIILLES